jgi:large subunit ribosomal protein L23
MNVLKKPIVTEKMTDLNEKGKYAFIVDSRANKIEIKNGVESMYGVNVVKVNTSLTSSKPKTRYTKKQIISGRTPSKKKAIITVAEGEIIDFYSEI